MEGKLEGSPSELQAGFIIDPIQHLIAAMVNHYEVLGVGRDATAEDAMKALVDLCSAPQDITRAYHNLARRHHPDRVWATSFELNGCPGWRA